MSAHGSDSESDDDDYDEHETSPYLKMKEFMNQVDVVVEMGQAAGAGSTIKLRREIIQLNKMRPEIGEEIFDVEKAKNLSEKTKKWAEKKVNEVDVWMKDTVKSLGSNMDDFRVRPFFDFVALCVFVG
jgi:hypothetical protein